MKIPKSTPAESICGTSVDEGRQSVQKETSLKILQKALSLERSRMNRKTMTGAIEARIRAIGKEKLKDLADKARRINGYRA